MDVSLSPVFSVFSVFYVLYNRRLYNCHLAYVMMARSSNLQEGLYISHLPSPAPEGSGRGWGLKQFRCTFSLQMEISFFVCLFLEVVIVSLSETEVI